LGIHELQTHYYLQAFQQFPQIRLMVSIIFHYGAQIATIHHLIQIYGCVLSVFQKYKI
jgi:hypothetical protein